MLWFDCYLLKPCRKTGLSFFSPQRSLRPQRFGQLCALDTFCAPNVVCAPGLRLNHKADLVVLIYKKLAEINGRMSHLMRYWIGTKFRLRPEEFRLKASGDYGGINSTGQLRRRRINSGEPAAGSPPF
jgi:hypothetical protein